MSQGLNTISGANGPYSGIIARSEMERGFGADIFDVTLIGGLGGGRQARSSESEDIWQIACTRGRIYTVKPAVRDGILSRLHAVHGTCNPDPETDRRCRTRVTGYAFKDAAGYDSILVTGL